jgi:hypothetical protein
MPLDYDNIRVKYHLSEQMHYLPTGKDKTVGFLWWKKVVPETVLETKEQVRDRLTGELVQTLTDFLGSKLSIEGLEKEAIKSASGKFYIHDQKGAKVASIDYSCGAYVPDSQLEPMLSRDAAVELIVVGDVLSSKDKYDNLKDRLYKLSDVDMDGFFRREQQFLQEEGRINTYPSDR